MAAKINQLLEEYGESHQNPINKAVHWVCVPAIVISLLGLVWSVPFPFSIQFGLFPLNWATIFIALTLIYYFKLSVSLALGMIVVTFLLIAAGYGVTLMTGLPLWANSLIIFVIAWIGQFWGHKIEGKKPSFLKDVQFLLIGPVWLLSFIYRRLGIPL